MIGYLRLVRLPNVFTALADIIAAFTIMKFSGASVTYATLALLMGASGALYLSGMALNDLADREEDARVRPNRPIPCGQVSVTAAAICGFALMFGGIGLAALSGVSLAWAVALAISILAYDFAAKHVIVLGPITLGFCRFFNVLLGSAVATTTTWEVLKDGGVMNKPLVMALTIGIYAAGLTAFSAQEETGKQIRSIVIGWFFCGIALALGGLTGKTFYGWIFLGPLLLLLLYRTVQLARSGTPIAARNLVRTGVMGVCIVDAGLVLNFAGPDAWPAAIGCAALLIPSILISKWLAQKEA